MKLFNFWPDLEVCNKFAEFSLALGVVELFQEMDKIFVFVEVSQ